MRFHAEDTFYAIQVLRLKNYETTENLEEQCCMRLCARIISYILQLCSLLKATRKKLCCAWLKVWADLCDVGAPLA